MGRGLGPGSGVMSPAFVRSSGRHPAGPQGQIAKKR